MNPTINIPETMAFAHRTASRLWAALAQKGVAKMDADFRDQYEKNILEFLFDPGNGPLELKKAALESEVERIYVYIKEFLDVEEKNRSGVQIDEWNIGASFLKSAQRRVDISQEIFKKVYDAMNEPAASGKREP